MIGLKPPAPANGNVEICNVIALPTAEDFARMELVFERLRNLWVVLDYHFKKHNVPDYEKVERSVSSVYGNNHGAEIDSALILAPVNPFWSKVSDFNYRSSFQGYLWIGQKLCEFFFSDSNQSFFITPFPSSFPPRQTASNDFQLILNLLNNYEEENVFIPQFFSFTLPPDDSGKNLKSSFVDGFAPKTTSTLKEFNPLDLRPKTNSGGHPIIIIGEQRSGKTHTVRDLIGKYFSSNPRRRKVLILSKKENMGSPFWRPFFGVSNPDVEYVDWFYEDAKIPSEKEQMRWFGVDEEEKAEADSEVIVDCAISIDSNSTDASIRRGVEHLDFNLSPLTEDSDW